LYFSVLTRFKRVFASLLGVLGSPIRRRLAISIGAATLFGFLPALQPATPSPVHIAPRLAASISWLNEFNAWRANAGVSQLTENTVWSQGDYDHAIYMVKNDLVTHSETPGTPYYTTAGATEAPISNIYVSSSTSTTDQQAIDWWMGAPFHAMAMMDPRLTQTGFGSYRDSTTSPWQMGAALDVASGNPFTGGKFPVYFPGNLSTEPLTAYSGNEFPDPQQACPGYSGLPVFVEIGSNVSTAAGPVHTITGNGTSLANCVIDSTNATFSSYTAPRGAVILMPQQTLQNGVTYTVALTVNGLPYTWSFTVGPLGSPTLPVVSIPLPAMANGAYGGYTTVIYVQNTATQPAHVTIRYLDTTGAPVGAGDSVAALASNAVWAVRQDNGNSFGSGGAGSAVVSSDQPIAAFVNEFAPGNASDASSYTAIPTTSATGGTLFAPTIASAAYGGYTTGIGLVNVGNSATTITITYRDSTGAVAGTQSLSGVAAGAYRGVYSGDSGQPGDAKLPGGFGGTATISASAGGQLAAIVNEIGPGGQFSSYNAVPAGGTTLYAPVALKGAYGGYNTGMAIQNTTGSSGTVTINYYDSGGAPTTHSFPIAANGSGAVYQGTDIPTSGAYTAKITSTVAVAAIVNEVAPVTGAAQQSTSYNALLAGASFGHLPLVESSGSDGWSTGLGIMNIGSVSTTATLTYYDATSGSPIGAAQVQTIAVNAFWGAFQPTAGLPAGSRATAVITTPSSAVAVIVNESSATTLMSYEGQ
jgi:uncharacterized protein YkwD